jgi:hypothetical protein
MSQELEEWLAFFSAQLPDPVEQQQALDGSIYFTGGEPGEVMVRLSASTITVWEYAARWEGPRTLVPRPVRVGSIAWRRVPASQAVAAVQALVDGARQSRRGKYSICSYCERLTAPEHMHDEETCMSCAEKHLGIVY